jgi:L-aminopeptidase/D-esterase-like protein
MITEVPGVKVGHVTDAEALTGVTVVLTEAGAIGALCVSGGAPGTFTTHGLEPLGANELVHGVVLTGGSNFGLAAVLGVMRYLEERDVGLSLRGGRVPIVPGAVIYDLGVGDGRVRPTEAWGYRAAEAASAGPVAQGNVGAGTGATAGKWPGGIRMKGGLGTASLALGGGCVVGAIVVVNPRGDLIDPVTRRLYAVHGGFDRPAASAPDRPPAPAAHADHVPGSSTAPAGSEPGTTANTTIGVVATNVRLTKLQLARVARMADDGLARAIRPIHTTGDGDVIFALSVLAEARDLPRSSNTAAADLVGTAAADVMVQAILNAARAATSIPGYPALGELEKGRD